MRSSGSSYACRSGDNTAKYLIRMEIFRGSSYACPMVGCPQPALRVINSAREFLCVPRPPPREFLCVPESTLREFVCVVLRRPGGSSYACSWPTFRWFLCASTPQGRRAKPAAAGVHMRAQRRRPREFLCVAPGDPFCRFAGVRMRDQKRACWFALTRFCFTLVAEGSSTKPLSATSKFACG